MIGPGGVVQLVIARLQAAVPDALAAYLTRDGLPTTTAPPPWITDDWPPQSIGLDLMPSLWVTEIGMNTVQGAFRSSPDPVDAIWSLRYALAIDGYVRSVTPTEVATQRRYLVTAVRQALLAAPGLIDTDTGSSYPEFYSAAVRIPGWKERYSNIGSINDDLVAGFTVELDVDTEERMYPTPPPIGPLEGVSIEVDLLALADPMP
jgi:hypothetical protein